MLGAPTATYVLTGRAEPLAVGDDHEGRPQAGCVVAAVAGVAQQDLERPEEAVKSPHSSGGTCGPGVPTSSG